MKNKLKNYLKDKNIFLADVGTSTSAILNLAAVGLRDQHPVGVNAGIRLGLSEVVGPEDQQRLIIGRPTTANNFEIRKKHGS